MNTIPLLPELALIALLGVTVTVLLSRLKLPTVAGLLAAGALLGPHGLGLVRNLHAIEVLAEVGVVLLLFSLGLEFSLKRLRHIFRRVALGGLVQVLSTAAATFGVAVALGETPGRAVFYGFVMAMSSTAIVLRAMSDRGELDAPHGRFIVGTLIFQDLCVVPMVLLVPVLGSGKPMGDVVEDIGTALGLAAVVVTGVLLLSRILVPRILRLVDASRSHEIFLLAILALCAGTAWLTSLTGLSLALGAFLGGMVVADTEFQHRALGEVIPFRNVFVSIFFISLGMLFNADQMVSQPVSTLLWFVGFVGAKAFLATLSALVIGFPARAAWLAGIGLGQFGEFGFVLLKLGESYGLVEPQATGSMLAAGILSMFFTPILIRLAPHISAGERLLAPLSRMLRVRAVDEMDAAAGERPSGHVVVIGYGVAGKLVARSLAASEVPHLVLELNAETVRRARRKGLDIYYADATSREALVHANVAGARAVVVLINDHQAALRVVDALHRVAPEVPVIARTRYFSDQQRLSQLGADEVVFEEVEASVEVVSRLLRRLEVPRNVIEQCIREARSDTQGSRRKVTLPRTPLCQHQALADLKIESVLVGPGSLAVGRSVLGLDLRRKTGSLIVAVRRGETLLEELDPGLLFAQGDVLYLVGSNDANRAAIALLDGQPAGDQPPAA